MKISFLIPALLFTSTFVSQTYSKEVEEKIKEVENNITGRLVLNNEKPSTILERMKFHNVKGLSIAIIENNKISWAKGYGWADEEEKRPVTPETLFEPGSISKSLNAVGILKLAQDKELDLNTDINTYLRSWKFPYDSLSKGKKITLTHILSHHAGLSVHGFPGHDIYGPIPTVYDILDGKNGSFTPPVRSMFEPGLRFQYSGGGTTISQVILSDITAQPYEVWMYENVLKPFGMVHSTYAQPPSKEVQKSCSSGYMMDGTRVTSKFHAYPEQGAAGLWMTPSDLCNYIIDMQLAYKGERSKVLSQDMIKLHLTPTFPDGSAALGTFVEEHDGAKFFTHNAGNDGFCGLFYAGLDDGFGVVIFANSNEFKIISEVLNSINKAYKWHKFYQAPKPRTSISMSNDVLKSYEGIYVFEDIWAAIGKKDKDKNYHFYSTGQYVKMYFSTPTHFYNEEFSSEKEFIKDEKGNVTGYKRTVDGKEFPKAIKVTNIDTLQQPSQFFNDVAWYFFECKKYDEAFKYYKRGVQLYPKELSIAGNMAHTYLLSGDYNTAIGIYKSHLNDMIKPELSWKKMMQDDAMWFKQNGYNVKPFDKVFTELNIERPKGF
jgi:CubicO group peptidase (beta-lactamase class C family)